MDTPYDEVLRAARRSADLSQRQLALRAGVAHSCVGRIESRRVQPSLALFLRLITAAGCELVLQRVDDAGRPPIVYDGPLRDARRRRYPPHLDLQLPSSYRHGLRPPRRPVPARYLLDRGRRDRLRWGGHIDVRVVPRPESLYGHHLGGAKTDRHPDAPP